MSASAARENKSRPARPPFKGAAGGDDRPKKDAFKPKEGFIAAGLKAYAETADAEALARKAEISKGWEDKTTTLTTLHMTHLPPSLTSPQLSLICSAYAPLRSAFVVSSSSEAARERKEKLDHLEGLISSANMTKTNTAKERGSTSRGFGYVRFVLQTDAEKCLQDWGTDSGIPRSALKSLEGVEGAEGIEWDKICGRGGVKLGWAKKKLREGEVAEPSAAAARFDRAKVDKSGTNNIAMGERKERPVTATGYDKEGSRTVIVQGIFDRPDEPLVASTTEVVEGEEEEAVEEDGGEGEDKMEEDAAEEGAEVAAPAGTPKEIDWKKVIKQKAKKWGDIEAVNYPVVLPSGETVATILLPTPRQAHQLSTKLHNHIFKNLLISTCIKSSWDLVQKLGRSKGGSRLVVRNLGFDVSVEDLRTLFAPFGPLHSITLPLSTPDATNPVPTPRGFAFIYYLSITSATKALTAINGTRVYAGMAKERIENEGGKGGNKKTLREKKKKDDKATLEKEGGGGAGGGGEKGRVVAVDWAVGKDEFKRAAANPEDEDADVRADDMDEDDESNEDDDEDKEVDEDEDMSPVPEDRHADDDDDELEEEPVGIAPQPQGTTLFVRNMSFEATESELYDLFKVFGPVRYARIVFDSTTKRSRGTAFVCFWNDADAQKVLYESESLNAGLFGDTSNKKQQQQNASAAHSLLMPDASSSTASKLVLHGRVLAAVLAVSKGDADELREDRDKKGQAKTDRRNLYLMREGVIFPSWAIAQTLHPIDLAARQSSFDARKGLLRSNPALYISRTRLSVRQIPLYVSDGMMKRLANYAMKEFDRDVKGGHQRALTADEINVSIADAGTLGGVVKLIPTNAERIRGVPPSRVRQAKILRQADRVDPLTGLGRSKGYGFLELATHADALRVLRWANANKDVGALFRGWWRETLEKMIERVENGESFGTSKGVTVKEKEERLKRLKEKMAELVEEEELAAGKSAKAQSKGKVSGEGGRNSKCLIVEFSIENAVTTKRRAEKADRSRERAKRSRERNADSGDEGGASTDDDESRSTKKRKAPSSSAAPSAISKKVKVAKGAKSEIRAADELADDGEIASKSVGAMSIGSIMGKKRRKGKK